MHSGSPRSSMPHTWWTASLVRLQTPLQHLWAHPPLTARFLHVVSHLLCRVLSPHMGWLGVVLDFPSTNAGRHCHRMIWYIQRHGILQPHHTTILQTRHIQVRSYLAPLLCVAKQHTHPTSLNPSHRVHRLSYLCYRSCANKGHL